MYYRGLAALTAVLLLSAVGCCVNRPRCGGEWWEDCQGSCGDCETGAPVAGSMLLGGRNSGVGGCTSCGPTGAVQRGYGPLQYAKYAATCGSGCGKTYWGEWSADPPDCCDPCDRCGNYAGPQGCCRPWLRNGWRNLWGYRYQPSSCGTGGCASGGCASGGVSSGGCSSCAGGGQDSFGGEVIYEDGFVSQGTVIRQGGVPRAAGRPIRAPATTGPRRGYSPSPGEPRRATRSILLPRQASYESTAPPRVRRAAVGSGVSGARR